MSFKQLKKCVKKFKQSALKISVKNGKNYQC